jgi:adenine-specific DNA-methyltransferase
LPNRIAGTDNDEGAVWLANVLLAAEVLPILARTPSARRRPLPALVALGDGLAEIEQQTLVTIMNPPYGRVRLGQAERDRFADSLYGHANLYGLFMAAGIEGLTNDGVLAALVPTSFLAGRYFENLRRALVQQAPLREIAFVADRSGSFGGVLQETCLATFSRGKARRVSIFTINHRRCEVANVASPLTVTPWLLPRHSDDASIAAAAMQMKTTLRSSGWRVSTGPLVWNRRKADLGPEPGPGRVPVLWQPTLTEAKCTGIRCATQRAISSCAVKTGT